MTTKFGSCMAPPGIRIPHETCKGTHGNLRCGCPCHIPTDERGSD